MFIGAENWPKQISTKDAASKQTEPYADVKSHRTQKDFVQTHLYLADFTE